MAGLYHEVTNKTLIAVSESPIQDMKGFKYNTLPSVDVDGITIDIRSTNYRLPTLVNSLRDDGTMLFEVGGAEPPQLNLNSVQATITPVGEQTHRIDRPLVKMSSASAAAFQASRFADLKNASPLLFNLAGLRINKDFLNKLTNTTLFGTAKHFSGTGALSAYSPDHQPLTDIETELEALRLYREFTNFELVCHVSSEVLRVLAKQNEYTGWAQAGGMPKAISVPQMAQMLKDVHGLDRVEICDTVTADRAYNADTATSPTWAKKELLTFGLFDKTKSYNLKGDPGFMAQGPDGALAIAWARQPVLVRWASESKETESFAVRWSSHIYSPRGNSSPLGIHFDDIFTASP